MGIIDAVASTLSSTDDAADDGQGDAGGSGDSRGAFWCDDCDVRVRGDAVDAAGLDRDADGTPRCPDCGASMRFERNYGPACAC